MEGAVGGGSSDGGEGEEEVQPNVLDDANFQLVLPSGVLHHLNNLGRQEHYPFSLVAATHFT